MIFYFYASLFVSFFIFKIFKKTNIAEYIINDQTYQNITGKYNDISKYKNIYSCIKSYEKEIMANKLEKIPISILYNKDFIIEALKLNVNIYYSLFDEYIILDNLDILNTIIENSEVFFFCNIPIKFRNNKEIVLKTNGLAEDYDILPKELQEDDDILNKALKEKGYYFTKGRGDFKYNDVRITLGDLEDDRYYGYFLLPFKFQDDIYIIKKALELNGNILKFLTHHKNNKELAKIAINENPKCCEFLDDIFKNDKEIALIALKKDISVIKYFSSSIKEDYEFLSKILEINEDLIKYTIIPYKGFESFWQKIIIDDVNNLKYLDEKWRFDKTDLKDFSKK